MSLCVWLCAILSVGDLVLAWLFRRWGGGAQWNSLRRHWDVCPAVSQKRTRLLSKRRRRQSSRSYLCRKWVQKPISHRVCVSYEMTAQSTLPSDPCSCSRPCGRCPTCSGDSLPGGQTPPPAHLCQWGELFVLLCCQDELALRTPPPAAFLLSHHEHGSGWLPSPGHQRKLGLAPVSQVREDDRRKDQLTVSLREMYDWNKLLIWPLQQYFEFLCSDSGCCTV